MREVTEQELRAEDDHIVSCLRNGEESCPHLPVE